MRINNGKTDFRDRQIRGVIAWTVAVGWCLIVLLGLILGGDAGFVGAIVAFVIFMCCSRAVGEWLYRRKSQRIWEKYLQEPCSHNVIGGAHNSSRCAVCTKLATEARLARERAEADETQRRQQAAAIEARRREEQRRSAYRAWVAKVRLPKFLKTVDPQEFEKIVCKLFARIGYKVEETRYVGDNGSDGFLYENGRKYVLQCKRVKGSVGEPILRDLFGTMHAENCHGAIVVTTGTVSAQARKWSAGKPIEIIELEMLTKLLREYFPKEEVVPAEFNVTEEETPVQFACTGCQRQLRVPRMNLKVRATCPDCWVETIVEPA